MKGEGKKILGGNEDEVEEVEEGRGEEETRNIRNKKKR
jgi:hypothetical protein